MAEKITKNKINEIKNKSVLVVGDNPSENGLSSDQIKKAIVDPVLEVIDEVNRIVNEVNSETGATIDKAEYVSNKIKEWSELNNEHQYPNAQLVKQSLDTKINSNNIADNLETEEKRKVLDASQGKILNDKINKKVDLVQGNENAHKVAVTNSNGNVYFAKTLPKGNMPEITIDMLPSGAGIIAEVANELKATGGNVTGDDIKQRLQMFDELEGNVNEKLEEIEEIVDKVDDVLKAEVICKHAIEITGNTGDEHGLAIEDQQVLIKKIQGQSIVENGQFKHSQCNLISTGRNLWDEQWESGLFGYDGIKYDNANYLRNKNIINALSNTNYYIKQNSDDLLILFYDINKNLINYTISNPFTTPNNCYYINFTVKNKTYNNDICINFSDATFNGTYEPYKEEIFVVNQELKAFDYIENEKKTFDTLEIDLSNSSLEWKYANDSNGKRFTCESLKNVITGSENNTKGYLLCSKYETGTYINVFYNQIDKVIAVNPSGTIAIYDSSYTDVNSFKASLNGVKLLYKANYSNVDYVDMPAGYSVYKGGYQIQDGEVPYILTKEYSMSMKAQILANVEIDREQQEQLNEVKEKINEAVSTSDSAYDLADEASEKTKINEQGLNVLEQTINTEKVRVNDLYHFMDYINPVVDNKADLDDVITKDKIQYGIINGDNIVGLTQTIDLSQFKYWKGIINPSGQTYNFTLHYLYDGDEEHDVYSFSNPIIEYINGTLLIQANEANRTFLLTSKSFNIEMVASSDSDAFSIYWKGEK